MSKVSVIKCPEKISTTMEFEVGKENFFLTDCGKSNWKDCVKSYICFNSFEKYTGLIKSVVEVSDREDLLPQIAKFGK